MVLGFEEKIVVALDVAFRNQRRFDEFNKRLDDMGFKFRKNAGSLKLQQKNFLSLAKVFGTLNNSTAGFFKVLGSSTEQMKKWNRQNTEFSKRGGKVAFRLKKMFTGLRGFRMEMLAVLFFGKAMLEFFKGLLRPALEITGIFELWAVTMQVLFLPIALALLDIFIPFIEKIINMSDKTKLLIGKLVLFGAVLGLVLFLIGTLVLGIGGIILALSGFFNILDKIIPDIEIFGNSFQELIVAGVGIGILTKVFKIVRSAASGFLEKILEFDIVEELFDRIGLKVAEGETPWNTLRLAIGKVIDKIKGEFDFSTEFGEFSSLIKDSVSLAKDMKGVLDDITKIDFNEIIDMVGRFLKVLEDISPALKSIGTLADIAIKALNKLKERREKRFQDTPFRRAIRNRRETGSFENPEIIRVRDFILTPAGRLIQPSPTDTIVGFQGGGGGIGGNITINQSFNIQVSDREEMRREIDDNNRRLVDELRRLTRP